MIRTAYLAFSIMLLVVPSFAVTLYVSPTGDDKHSGEKVDGAAPDGPLSSLQAARDRIRAMRKTAPLSEPVHVVIHDGTYFLSHALELTADDSGTTECPISYEAAPGAKPIFSGGITLTGWREQNGIWTADTRPSGAGRFEQLFVNGRRATRARTPNTWFSMSTPPSLVEAQQLTSNATELARRILTLNTTDTAELSRLSPAELTSAVLVGYHSWESSRHYIEALNSTGTTVLTGPAAWPFHRWGNNQRYSLENYPAALDAPGEWFLDAKGKLSYIPLPGETLTNTTIVAPVADAFIQIEGDRDEKRHVAHVAFKGLAFHYSAYRLPPQGHSDPQAETGVPAVVDVRHANHIRFENCEFSHLGTSAVWLRHGCTQSTVEHCLIEDVGGGGVMIGETTTPVSPHATTGRNLVQNNIIRSCGRLHTGAIGVWIGRSSYNCVLHNEIADNMYTGISMGWEWGYAPADCHHNEIGYNHIHHLGWGLLSDMGGIYTLGASPGTTLHHNLIHDIRSYNKYGAGGWGLYNDEGSSGILSESNVVYNCRSTCYHQHYGGHNVVRNNIFAYGDEAAIQLSRPEPHLSFTVEQNIICAGPGALMNGVWKGAQVNVKHNLFWKFGGDALTSAALEYDTGKTALDANSLIADPQFVDPTKFDFHLQPDSPSLKVGYTPWPYEQAGVTGTPEWLALARKPVHPPTEFPQ